MNIKSHLHALIVAHVFIALPALADELPNGNLLGSVSHDSVLPVETVLDELSRQHNNVSSLVKAAREPVSLAMNSPLMSKSALTHKKDVDVVGQLTAVASSTVSKFKQSGMASWYGRQFHGKKTANGETFDMNAMTAAHPSLPLNCYVRVTNKDNGKSVVVRINDRSSLHNNRVMDLSYAAAKAIGITAKGTGNIILERIESP